MNEDQAYQDGQDAYALSEPITSCPHRPSLRAPHLYDCWAQGWLDARDQHQRKAHKAALFPQGNRR